MSKGDAKTFFVFTLKKYFISKNSFYKIVLKTHVFVRFNIFGYNNNLDEWEQLFCRH